MSCKFILGGSQFSWKNPTLENQGFLFHQPDSKYQISTLHHNDSSLSHLNTNIYPVNIFVLVQKYYTVYLILLCIFKDILVASSCSTLPVKIHRSSFPTGLLSFYEHFFKNPKSHQQITQHIIGTVWGLNYIQILIYILVFKMLIGKIAALKNYRIFLLCFKAQCALPLQVPFTHVHKHSHTDCGSTTLTCNYQEQCAEKVHNKTCNLQVRGQLDWFKKIPA